MTSFGEMYASKYIVGTMRRRPAGECWLDSALEIINGYKDGLDWDCSISIANELNTVSNIRKNQEESGLI